MNRIGEPWIDLKFGETESLMVSDWITEIPDYISHYKLNPSFYIGYVREVESNMLHVYQVACTPKALIIWSFLRPIDNKFTADERSKLKREKLVQSTRSMKLKKDWNEIWTNLSFTDDESFREQFLKMRISAVATTLLRDKRLKNGALMTAAYIEVEDWGCPEVKLF